MLHTSEAIVLRTFRHEDSNLVVKAYTREQGMQSFILKGYASARSRQRFSYFQPLSIVEIVYQSRPNRDLHKVDESRAAVMLHRIQSDPIKLSLGLAIIEIFYDCVKESEADLALYSFLREVLLKLEATEDKNIHIFLWYLVHLTRMLGFFPSDEVHDLQLPVWFSPDEGIVMNTQGNDIPTYKILLYFMRSPLEDCQGIQFNQGEKRQLIQLLFDYYYCHIQGFRIPKTLSVFAEIFAG